MGAGWERAATRLPAIATSPATSWVSASTKRRPRLVGQGDPALQVEPAGRLVEQGDIVRLPREAGGQVAEVDEAGPGAVGIHRHRQGRAGAQGLRHAVEDHTGRDAVVAQHLDAVADLQDHPFVGRQHRGRLGDLLAVAGIGADDLHLLADRLLHHLLGGEQVEVEVLLDDGEAVARQGDGLGTDRRRDVLQLQPLAAGGDVEAADVVHQGLVLIVDGDGEAGLFRRLGRRRVHCRDREKRPHEQRIPDHEGSLCWRPNLSPTAKAVSRPLGARRRPAGFLKQEPAGRRRSEVGVSPNRAAWRRSPWTRRRRSWPTGPRSRRR